MFRKQKNNTVSRRLYFYIFVPILITIFLSSAVTLYYALNAKQKELDRLISETASNIAALPATRELLLSGEPDPDYTKTLDLYEENISQLDTLVICNRDSIRLYHTVADRIGLSFVGGDEGPILEGADPYISIATGTLGLQRRAFHPVTDGEGRILGFVMASVLNSSLTSIRTNIILTFLLIFLVMVGIGCITAETFRYQLSTTLLGHNPEDFVNLYVERSEVLDALEEGIFAINTEGQVILMNQSAKKMLNLPADYRPEGTPLVTYYPETQLPNTVRTGIPEHNINFVINDKNIISSRIPIEREGQIIGAVSIFRNKTEVTKLAEELTGAKYMVDTLRAMNHEFMNKLHVILGSLEIGDVEQAKSYIINTSLVSGAAVSDIHHRVPSSTLAALLIGKLIRASELGITLTLQPDSCFYRKQHHLPSDCYITLVGNLLENAIYELNSQDYPVKQINLGIYSGEGHTTIICDDTGGGIPEDILEHIYDRTTTTKGEGHGHGFPLMKEITDRYHGTIHIETELGEGTSVEINLPI
ncbi:MAG: sensor histidine kinase [Lachnospiraceae bacterium]|nr:sensor histidine kinase [Lachnospiraceae bacterium]